MMIVLSDAFLTHAGPLTSQQDYAVLGFRPISSRTYFAVRLTKMIVQATAMTALTAWPPVLAYLVVRGPNPGLAIGAAFTIWWASITAMLAFAGAYATLLRIAGAERVKRALSYMQMLTGMATFGGFALMMDFVEGPTLRGLGLPRAWWLVLVPPAWFAGVLASIAGQGGALLAVLTAMAIAATIAAILAVRGTASGQYFERLSAFDAVAPPTSAPRRAWLPSPFALWKHEARAASILIRSQFKHDMAFRMGVLGVLPMVVLYLIMGMKKGGLIDPFLRWQHKGASGMAEMGILMLPSLIWQPLRTSPSYAASWIYFVSPADRGAIVRGARNALGITIVVPYLLLLAAILIYFTGAVVHVLIHVGMLWLVSTITLQLVAFFNPGLPFAESPAGQSASGSMFIVSLVVMVAGMGSTIALQLLIYPAPARILPAALVLMGASYLLDRFTIASIRRRAALRQFAG
jgi:hypothetical protein